MAVAILIRFYTAYLARSGDAGELETVATPQDNTHERGAAVIDWEEQREAREL